MAEPAVMGRVAAMGLAALGGDQDTGRRWVFSRFWDPRIARSYFTGIRDWPDRVARFFHIAHGGQRIQMFIDLVMARSREISSSARRTHGKRAQIPQSQVDVALM